MPATHNEKAADPGGCPGTFNLALLKEKDSRCMTKMEKLTAVEMEEEEE